MRATLAVAVAIGLLGGGTSTAAQDLTPGSEPAARAESSGLADAQRLPLPVGMRLEARRPASLPALYVSFGVLQGVDLWQTNRLIDRGVPEGNPVMAWGAGHPAGMFAIKAATTVSTVYFVERLWKRDHRVAAIVTMVAINAATTAVVAHNARQLDRR